MSHSGYTHYTFQSVTSRIHSLHSRLNYLEQYMLGLEHQTPVEDVPLNLRPFRTYRGIYHLDLFITCTQAFLQQKNQVLDVRKYVFVDAFTFHST